MFGAYAYTGAYAHKVLNSGLISMYFTEVNSSYTRKFSLAHFKRAKFW